MPPRRATPIRSRRIRPARSCGHTGISHDQHSDSLLGVRVIVPDGLVYAAIAPALYGLAKVAQWFVQDVQSVNRKAIKKEAEKESVEGISLSDFEQMGRLLTKELNGRYMFAPEARARFDALEKLVAGISDELKFIVAELTKEKENDH